MFCHICGTQISEGAGFCHKCGARIAYKDNADVQKKDAVSDDNTFFNLNGGSVDIGQGEGEHDKGKIWEKVLAWIIKFVDEVSRLPAFWKWFIGIISLISLLAACGAFIVYAFIIIFQLLRLIFSSSSHVMITMIIVGVGGYILYHSDIAKIITEFIYQRESKQLYLPEGMSASMLLEVLSGKFNYPYFKGVHYGSNGECVIEGKYSMYPVVFKSYDYIVLDCVLRKNDKKKRAVLLEAMAIRDYINKFFDPTLPIDTIKSMKKLRFAEGQRKAVAIGCAVAEIILVGACVLFVIAPENMESRIQNMVVPGTEVRNAYLSQYSRVVTIEEAFENFFDKCKWESNNSGDYPEVIFTGVCRYNDERADVRIVFKISGENFIVDSLDINGRRQSDLMLNSLMLKVYENYQ